MAQPHVLIEVTRSGVVEVVHRGSIVVVHEGEVIAGLGDQSVITPMRSTAKPFQVGPLLLSKGQQLFDLAPEDIAVLVSSHNGQERHVKVISKLLAKAALSEDDLKCGYHLPFSLDIYEEVHALGGYLRPIHNNCSGKHTGMLLLCRALSLPTDDYWQPCHPTQQLIAEFMAGILGPKESILYPLTDGCGVPTFGVCLKQIACAYCKLSEATQSRSGNPLATVARAMVCEPFMVGGTGRAETRIMEATGMVAKSGADGIFCIAVPGESLGIAVKMESGSEIASECVAIEVLRQLSLLNEPAQLQLQDHLRYPVRTHTRRVVGSYVPVFELASEGVRWKV